MRAATREAAPTVGAAAAAPPCFRSHVSLGASTAVGSLASSGVAGGGGGGGSINSHAIAEAFWTRWREKQLPEGVPPPGEVAVVVEVRYEERGISVQHDGAKYERYAAAVQEVVERVLGASGHVIVVPEGRDAATRAIASWQTAHGARLGAFEVQMCYRAGGGLVSELLHSKLITNRWPHKDLGKIERALRSFSRTVRLRPFMYSEGGKAVPINPPPAKHLVVRMGKAVVPCRAVAVAPMPSGAVDLAGQPVTDPIEKDVAEAARRVHALSRTGELTFCGAAHQRVAHYVENAWTLQADEETGAANDAFLRKLLKILQDFPKVCCEVHGETGKASSAPPALHSYVTSDHAGEKYARADPKAQGCRALPKAFRIDARSGRVEMDRQDVGAIMEVLAFERARSCREWLIQQGVHPSRVFITYRSMGGNVGVHFKPLARNPLNDGSGGHAADEAVGPDTLQAMAFQMPRGNELEYFVGIDPGEGPCQYKPFLTQLSTLMLGTAGASGTVDVPIELQIDPDFAHQRSGLREDGTVHRTGAGATSSASRSYGQSPGRAPAGSSPSRVEHRGVRDRL